MFIPHNDSASKSYHAISNYTGFCSESYSKIDCRKEKIKRLQAKFMKSNNIQSTAYIKDLEMNIVINKELIKELVSNSNLEIKYKIMLDKLNTKNLYLHTQMKETLKERDDIQAKLLVSKQIIELYKMKDSNQFNEYTKKIDSLLEELDKKDFMIQTLNEKLRLSKDLLMDCNVKNTKVTEFIIYARNRIRSFWENAEFDLGKEVT